MDSEAERSKLHDLFVSRGAGSERASIMASQLQKRASQLAEERGVGRVEAMNELLKVVVSGLSGEGSALSNRSDSDLADT